MKILLLLLMSILFFGDINKSYAASNQNLVMYPPSHGGRYRYIPSHRINNLYVDEGFVCSDQSYVQNYIILRSTFNFRGKFPEEYNKIIQEYIESGICMFKKVKYRIPSLVYNLSGPSIKENGLWGKIIKFYYTRIIIINDGKPQILGYYMVIPHKPTIQEKEEEKDK